MTRRPFLYVSRIAFFALLATSLFRAAHAQQSEHLLFLPQVAQIGISKIADCNPTGGTGGLEPGIHETTVAGRPAIVIVGDGYDPRTPTVLSFYLHGSNKMYDNNYDSYNDSITELVNEKDWIFVSPLWSDVTPVSTPEEGRARMEEESRNYVSVLNEMFARYNVCRNFILGSSASLGSSAWTNALFPLNGETHTAHIVLHCGAGILLPGVINGEHLDRLAEIEAVKHRTELYFVFGTEDFLIQPIRDTISVYQSKGFDVKVLEFEGEGHCTYNLGYIDIQTTNIWREMVQRAEGGSDTYQYMDKSFIHELILIGSQSMVQLSVSAH